MRVRVFMDAGIRTRTGLLDELRSSRRDSLDRLLPVVYEELRAIAHRHLAKHGPGGSLATTGLVHEAVPQARRSVAGGMA